VTIGILDNDVGVGFAEGRYEVQEFEPAVTLTVIRGGDVQEPFRVDYATADSTARSGEDYVGTAGTLQFARGENSKTITIQILNDSLTEGVESFFVRLTNPTGNRNLGQANTVVLIVDDDPGVGFSDADVWVVESQPSVMLRVFRGSDDLASFTPPHCILRFSPHPGQRWPMLVMKRRDLQGRNPLHLALAGVRRVGVCALAVAMPETLSSGSRWAGINQASRCASRSRWTDS
jgi:hypothetical protein